MQKISSSQLRNSFNRVKRPQGKGYHQKFQIDQSQYNLGSMLFNIKFVVFEEHGN